MPLAAAGILASIDRIGDFVAAFPEAAAPGNDDLARGTTKELRQDVSRTVGHGLPIGRAMCDNVTHEGDLDQGAAPAYRRVGARGPEARIDSRSRSAHAGRDADARQRRAAVNLFARWKPLKRFAKALDRPVGGTPVEAIISLDRDR